MDEALILKYEQMITDLKTKLSSTEKRLEVEQKSKPVKNENLTKYIEELDIKLSHTEIEKMVLE